MTCNVQGNWPDAAVLLVKEAKADVEAPADDESVYAGVVDLTALVNKVRVRQALDLRPQTPLAVSPRQPLEVVIQLFKSMGPRVVLVEQHGALVGLLTLKDMLRVINDEDARVAAAVRRELPAIRRSSHPWPR